MAGASSAERGAGRTDSGVHAAAQVASITLDHPIRPTSCCARSTPRLKAGDIRIRAIEEMPDRWDARIFAKSKTYRYAIWNGAACQPVLPARGVARAAAARSRCACSAPRRALVGEHDFVAFQGGGSDVKTTVRRVLARRSRRAAASRLDRRSAGATLLHYQVTGTGFLRHMVRNIVGTLVDIGRPAISDDMRAIIASRDRAGRATAPPHGLMLLE